MQRVAAAVVGVPLIILTILIGGNWYVAVVAVILAVACLEFEHPHHGWLHPLSLLTAALAAAMPAGAHVGFNWLVWFLAGAVILPLVVALVVADLDTLMADWLSALGGVMYVGFLGSFAVLLRDVHPNGRDWVLLVVLGTFAVDTSSYFAGRAFGRRQLAAAISPHKTVEGLVGGYAGGFAAVLLLNYLLGLRIQPQQAFVLGLLLPPAAALGDLAESAMKRGMQIKDASELIPGHGGVLDRLDSLLFTFTLVYLFTQWVVV